MTDPNDLTSFLKKEPHKKILIISDFEGTAPKEHFKAFEKEIKEGKVIFLGDIFDNTVVFDNKDCESRDCKNPEADNKCIKAENYCALQTIKLLVDYPDNCRYVVGNRDLNKIKLWPFFQKENKHKWWRYKNEDSIDEWTSYKEIVKYLLDNETQMDWHITGENIDLFKPFWNDKLTWEKKDNYNTDIFARFEALFGKDGDKGSISALVTLKGIPEEIFYSIHPEPEPAARNDTRDKFYNYINHNKDQPSPEWRKKVRAALVITIFMRMLDHELFPDTEDLYDEEKIKERRSKIVGKFGALDGYLYHYLMNAKPAYYAKYDKNILLFAHGGITPDFIKTGGNKAFEILHTVKWEERIFSNKIGGGDQIESYDEIKESIETFNDHYFQYLLHFFADAFMIRALMGNMLILLQISAPDKYFARKTEYRDKFSPIQIKEPNTPWDILDIDESHDKIFNIFGHGSSSAGYSFGLLKYPDSTKNSNTYYINTDFSTTLYKNDISCENYNKNKLLLYLTLKNNNVELNLVGTVILNEKYKPFDDELHADDNNNLFNAFAELKNEKATKENPKPDYNALISNKGKEEKRIRTLYYIHDNSGEKIDNGELKYEFDEDYNLMDAMDDYSNSPPDTGAFKYNGIVLINNKRFRAYSSTFWVYDKKAGDATYFIFLPTEIVAYNKESHVTNNQGGKKKYRKTKRRQYKKIKTRRIQRKKRSNRKTRKGNKHRKNKKTKRRM